jgi:hypothetical protein
MKSCQVAAIHQAAVCKADTVGSLYSFMLYCCSDYRAVAVCFTLHSVTSPLCCYYVSYSFSPFFYTGVQLSTHFKVQTQAEGWLEETLVLAAADIGICGSNCYCHNY